MFVTARVTRLNRTFSYFPHSLPPSLPPSSFLFCSPSPVPHLLYLTTLSVGWIVVYFAAGSTNSSGGGGGCNALTHVGSSDGRSDTLRVRSTAAAVKAFWISRHARTWEEQKERRERERERGREVKFGRGSFTLITRIKVRRGRGRRVGAGV